MKKKLKNFIANLFAAGILIGIIISLIKAFHVEIIIVLSVIFLLFLIFKVIEDYKIKKEREKIISSGILEIDKMTGYEFEDFLSYLFDELDYIVLNSTNKSGDFGADLIIKNNDSKKIAVQAKRYKNNVPPKAVQEVCGAIGYYNCDQGLVVTNSNLTSSAKKLAKKNNIEVWERDKLINKLSSLNY